MCFIEINYLLGFCSLKYIEYFIGRVFQYRHNIIPYYL